MTAREKLARQKIDKMFVEVEGIIHDFIEISSGVGIDVIEELNKELIA
jgi:hypothetical protein